MKSSESTSENLFFIKQIDFVWNINLLNEVI